jgi:hypothetical protein
MNKLMQAQQAWRNREDMARLTWQLQDLKMKSFRKGPGYRKGRIF